MVIAGSGRFSEPGLHVLFSLLDGPKHGYAISDDIAQLTGRRPGPGTLYGAIGRLEARGLIEAQDGEGRRKPYTLTPAGLAQTRLEHERLSYLAQEAGRRLGLRSAGV